MCAGLPVVTHMTIWFSMLDVVFPHLQLPALQQLSPEKLQPYLMQGVTGLGAFATAADTITSTAVAAWRTGGPRGSSITCTVTHHNI